MPWWTSFWGLPFRAVLRRLSRLSPATRRVLLCHNVEDHEGGAVRRFLTLGAFSRRTPSSSTPRMRPAWNGSRPERPFVVLPHPVAAAASPASRRRRGGGSARDGPLVLFLGLVRRYKGVELLLDAAPEIVRATGARIAVVGEVFPDAQDLARRAASEPRAGPDSLEGRVRVRRGDGRSGSRPATSSSCRTGRSPGSGIAARAIGAGRPMAAAAVGGLAECVEAGVTGELFAPGDAAGLAAAVENGPLARHRGLRARASPARPSAPRGRATSSDPRIPLSARRCELTAERRTASIYSASHEPGAHRGAAAPPDLRSGSSPRRSCARARRRSTRRASSRRTSSAQAGELGSGGRGGRRRARRLRDGHGVLRDRDRGDLARLREHGRDPLGQQLARLRPDREVRQRGPEEAVPRRRWREARSSAASR